MEEFFKIFCEGGWGIHPLLKDNKLKDLISKMPETEEELLKVAGFGQVKVRKYGDEVLGIVKRYRGSF